MRNNITKFVSYTLNNMLRLPSMYLIILIFMYKKINPEEPTTSNFKRNTSTRKNFRVPHINTKFGCI